MLTIVITKSGSFYLKRPVRVSKPNQRKENPTLSITRFIKSGIQPTSPTTPQKGHEEEAGIPLVIKTSQPACSELGVLLHKNMVRPRMGKRSEGTKTHTNSHKRREANKY